MHDRSSAAAACVQVAELDVACATTREVLGLKSAEIERLRGARPPRVVDVALCLCVCVYCV